MGNSLSYQRKEENTTNSNKNSENNNENDNIMKINKDNLVDLVDEIATKFILQQNMVDMIRFTDKKYYDNLIILTSSIMKKELTDLELGILQDRVLNSVNNNTQNINNDEHMENNHIYFTNAEQLKRISLIGEKEKQKALYLISKFYIKIMTVFSAITSIIDPQYAYQDEQGNKKLFHLKDFNDYKMVNQELNTITLEQLYNPMSFVKKRLNILKNKMNDGNQNSEQVTINPGELFCKSDENDIKSEIGIKELDTLYFDIYDYDNNKWGKMSSSMKEKYERDLTKFYQIFSGKKIDRLKLHHLMILKILNFINYIDVKPKNFIMILSSKKMINYF